MSFKFKRIIISLKSAWKYCTGHFGYWGAIRINFKWKQTLQTIWAIILVLLFIPYCILDLIFSILIAPFIKKIDALDDTNDKYVCGVGKVKK